MHIPQRGRSDLLPLKHQDYAAHLFQSGSFSDCTVHSKQRVWHLHRCILSPRSEFFWGCFEGEFEEANSCMIEMQDDDPQILEKMLRWIYTMHLPEPQDKSRPWTENVLLYVMADKYGLAGLMEATRNALLDEAIRCSVQPSRLADSMKDYIEAVEMLYNELPEVEYVVSLRSDIVKHTAGPVAQHVRSFPMLQDLMANPSFGVALVEHLAKGCDGRRGSTSSLSSRAQSTDSGSLDSISRNGSPQYTKAYVPLNEDSDEEFL